MSKKRFSNVDYSYSLLPTSRKAAFKDVYKHNFMTIFKCGTMLFLSLLPILIFSVFMEIGKMGMTLEFYSEEDLFGVLLLWDISLNLGLLILFIIVILFLSGIFRVLKLLVFQEGIDFFYDFRMGIKENFKHFFLIYLIFASFYALTYLLRAFFFGSFIGPVALLICLVMFLPALLWSYLHINIYQTKMWDYIKASYFFYFKNIGWSLLGLLMVVWPIIIIFLFYENLIFNNIDFIFILVKDVLLIALSLFYYPMVIVIFMLFSNSKFDLYINQDNYPEIYRKGLYQPKEK